MLLGFKRQFAPYVEDGSKTHTIRDFRKIAPRVGETCHCYVNPRQKTMRLLGRFLCVKIEPITIDFESSGIGYRLRLTINNQTLDEREAILFATRDGFRGANPLDQMAFMWIASGRLKDELSSPPWHGQIIHWAYPSANRSGVSSTSNS